MQDRTEHLDAAKGHVEDAIDAVARAWGRCHKAGANEYNYSLEGAMDTLRHVLVEPDAALYPPETESAQGDS